MIVKDHKSFIVTGSLLWIAGVVLAAAKVYPFAFIGIYLAPVILVAGITGWIINYSRVRNQFPNPVRSFNTIHNKHTGVLKYHFAAFEFLFTYVLHFWTLCVVFWMGLTFLSTGVIKNSDAFETTKRHVENDSELINRIGEVKYYGFLISGTISSGGNANISFSIIGQKETIDAKALLKYGEVIDIEYK